MLSLFARDDRAVILRSRSYQRCADRALVLQALDIECEWGMGAGGTVLLYAPNHVAGRAMREIVAYETEQSMRATPRSAPPPSPATRRDARVGVIAYMTTLLSFAYLQTRYSGGIDWLDAGRMQAGLVRSGEWWRVITALTLHLDTPHLLGNLIFGSAFGYLTSVALGSSALAWLSILLAGAMGNLLNAFLQPVSHSAVGASTAVFAALGLLAAYQWRAQLQPGERWLRRLGPIFASIALLALLGTGDERTDVSAHLTGFACGLAAGVGWSLRPPPAVPNASVSIATSISCGVLLWGAWQLAVNLA
jgi:rhomboid protease GluP